MPHKRRFQNSMANSGVSADPHDPASIEGAIQEMEQMVDQRAGAYQSNPLIAPLIDTLKERYREGILEKAANARLSGDNAE
jgi:hypothetical protein